MKRAKNFALIVACIICLSTVFSGCSGNNPDQSGQSGQSKQAADTNSSHEPVSISIAYWDIGKILQGQPDKMYEQVKKDLNITFEPISVTWNDYIEKIKVFAATNDLPDLVATDGLSSGDTWSWQEGNLIKGIPKDLSAYPNLQKYMSDKRADVFLKDDKYWGIPRIQFQDLKYAYSNAIVVNKKVYEEAGIKKAPETLEEFIDMLKKFKEVRPEATPLGSNLSGWFINYMAMAYNPALGGGGGWIEEGGKYVDPNDSSKNLELLKACRKVWDAGVLDKDFALSNNSSDVFKENFISEKSSAYVLNSFPVHLQDLSLKWNAKHPNGPAFSDSVILLPPLKGMDGNFYSASENFWSETYIGGKVDDNKLEKILKLFDYLLSEKGTMLRHFGIEGTDYTKNGDNIQITRPKNSNGVYKTLLEIYPTADLFKCLPTWDADFSYNDPAGDLGIMKLSNDMQEWAAKNTKKPDYNLNFAYVQTPSRSKFKNISSDDLIKIMVGKDDVTKMYNDMMNKFNKAGLQQMLEDVNKAAKEKGVIK